MDLLKSALSNVEKTAQHFFQPQPQVNHNPMNQNFAQQHPILEGIKDLPASFGILVHNAPKAVNTMVMHPQEAANLARTTPKYSTFHLPGLQTAANFAANEAQSFGQGLQNMAMGVNRIQTTPGVLNKVAGAGQILKGAGQTLSPFTAPFEGFNAATALPQQHNILNPAQRFSAGVVRGMSSDPTLAPNIKNKYLINTKIAGNDVKIDPLESAGEMLGFIKNPVNKQIFSLINKVVPTGGLSELGSLKKFVALNGFNGSLVNIFTNLDQLPANPTEKQKEDFMVVNGLGGFITGAGGSLLNEAGGKVLSKGIKIGQDSQILSKAFDQLQEFKRHMVTPVATTQFDSNGKRIVIPMWQYLLKDQTGFVKLDLGIGGKSSEPVKIPPELKPLAKLAQKYNTPEEFINNTFIGKIQKSIQSDPIQEKLMNSIRNNYGSVEDFFNAARNEAGMPSAGNTITLYSGHDSAKGSRYFSPDRGYAAVHGKNIREVSVPKSDIFDTNNPEHMAIFKQIQSGLATDHVIDPITGLPASRGDAREIEQALQKAGYNFKAIALSENTGSPGLAETSYFVSPDVTAKTKVSPEPVKPKEVPLDVNAQGIAETNVAQPPANDTPISSEGIVKKGKIKIKNFPTQTEIKNRVSVDMTGKDLYENAGLGNPEPLPFDTNNPVGEQVNGMQELSTNPEQNKMQSGDTHTPQSASPVQDISQQNKKQQPLIDSQGQMVDTSLPKIVDSPGFDVKKKVAIWDYVRTPDRVLNKIGMGKEAVQLRNAYDSYIKELPQQIDKITQWSKRVPQEENEALFRYLDGQTSKKSLSPETQKVAGEIKAYLSNWANRLGLSKDQRITNYITHIFDKESFTKEIDPDLAKIIRDKVAGSVYDPFTEKRLGALGYKEDTWAALDAYVKRATRKVNMDPILNTISDKADNLEESQFNYVKRYIANVNMQPTTLDNLVDNSIKQLVGYRFGGRPIAYLSRRMRQLGFRGALGLNVGSALRNLTQGVNTYAKLGERYTITGYANLAKAMTTGGMDELEQQGILRNDFVQDRTISVGKQILQRVDTGLFKMFEAAEKINRGAAYFGAKAKALNEGKTEAQAINYAKNIVRDTQFTFGSVNTPVAMQSDLAKTLLQFQSYNTKQAEFLGEMVKNKDVAGLIRYAIGSFAVASTIGKLFGMKPADMIPFYGTITGGGGSKPGRTPAINALLQTANIVNPSAQDDYGNSLSMEQKLGNAGSAWLQLLPGEAQAKKTFQGLQTVNQGYASNASGSVQIPIEQSVANYIRGAIFGKNYLPGVQDYYNSNQKPLSKDQSTLYKTLPQSGRQDFFNQTISNRQQNTIINQIKSGDIIKSTPKGAQQATYSMNGKDVQGYQVGDKFVYKEKGKWKTSDIATIKNDQLSYTADLASAQMTTAKNAGNLDLWMKAAQAQAATLEKQLQDPDLTELEKTRIQNKLYALAKEVTKYRGYGGFTKGKAFKTPKFVPLRHVQAVKSLGSIQLPTAPQMPITNVNFSVPALKVPQIAAPNFKAKVKFNL